MTEAEAIKTIAGHITDACDSLTNALVALNTATTTGQFLSTDSRLVQRQLRHIRDEIRTLELALFTIRKYNTSHTKG